MAVKLANKKKEKENTGKLVVAGFLEYLCALWALVFVIAVPVYMKNAYFEIGVAKYNAYAHIVVFGFPVILLFVLLYMGFSLREKKTFSKRVTAFLKSMSLTDWFVVGYVLFVLLSFFVCDYKKEAFWGYDGWYMGLFSQLTFVVIYFAFSRFLKSYNLLLTVLCATAFYVFVLGILHRLLIDPLNVYEGLSYYHKNRFLSTLGQASWYSGFMMTVLPIGMFLFWNVRHLALRVAAGIFTLAGFMTLVSQNTDSAYFAFLAAMLVLLYVAVKDAGSMRKWFELAFLFCLAPKCMQFLLMAFPNELMEWDFVSKILIFDNRVWALVILCALMILLFWFMEKKGIYAPGRMVVARNVCYGCVGALVVLWVLLLVGSAKGWLPAGILAVTEPVSYLNWSNSWGNGRGFTWSFTMQMIDEMSLKHKLFGVGPDCYALYGHGLYNDLIKTQWNGAILNNAHNEWLNMVVNMGIFGGVAYLGAFVSALVRFVKRSATCPVLLGFAMCIAAYMAHNMFCYQQVLCTPFIFLFMAMGEYQLRKKTKQEP